MFVILVVSETNNHLLELCVDARTAPDSRRGLRVRHLRPRVPAGATTPHPGPSPPHQCSRDGGAHVATALTPPPEQSFHSRRGKQTPRTVPSCVIPGEVPDGGGAEGSEVLSLGLFTERKYLLSDAIRQHRRVLPDTVTD